MLMSLDIIKYQLFIIKAFFQPSKFLELIILGEKSELTRFFTFVLTNSTGFWQRYLLLSFDNSDIRIRSIAIDATCTFLNATYTNLTSFSFSTCFPSTGGMPEWFLFNKTRFGERVSFIATNWHLSFLSAAAVVRLLVLHKVVEVGSVF